MNDEGIVVMSTVISAAEAKDLLERACFIMALVAGRNDERKLVEMANDWNRSFMGIAADDEDRPTVECATCAHSRNDIATLAEMTEGHVLVPPKLEKA